MAIATAAIRAGRDRELCPVTQSGRELSSCQIARVLAVHPGPLVIAFDGDAAGAESNERVARAVARAGRPVMVTTLPDGHDPASWLEEKGDRGLDAWSPASSPGRARHTPAHLVDGRHDFNHAAETMTSSDAVLLVFSEGPEL